MFAPIFAVRGKTILWTVNDGVIALRERGAKITAQRLAILKSLEGRKDHPSADMIYKNLLPDYPTMSVATVYSTAKLLADAGLIKVITIDNKRVYFDPQTDTHGHFRCNKCGKISDFNIDEKMMLAAARAENVSEIENAEVFLYGICSNCL